MVKGMPHQTRSRMLAASFLLVLIGGLVAGPLPAQAQPQSALAEKNIPVQHAFECNVPIFELTDRGLRAALDSGGVASAGR